MTQDYHSVSIPPEATMVEAQQLKAGQFTSRRANVNILVPRKGDKTHTPDTDPVYKAALHKAVVKGDWDAAKSITDKDPTVLTMSINDSGDSVFHVATRFNRFSFVEKLLQLQHDIKTVLEMKNDYGNTALCIAAALGSVEIASLMVNRIKDLPLIRGSGWATPVLIAATYRHKEMVSYLLSVTPVHELPAREQMELLGRAISADYYDIAFLVLEWNKSLALGRDINEDTPLHMMAQKSSGIIGSKNEPSLWHSYINLLPTSYKKTKMRKKARQLVSVMWNYVVERISESDMWDTISYPSCMLHEAAKVGNVEFVKLLIDSKPFLAWKVDENGMNLFHVAVMNRQESVFRLIYKMGEFLDCLPYYFGDEKISLLQLAAGRPVPSHLDRVSGAAFQMHRELLWFKEVEKIAALTMKRKKTNLTMRELFSQEHKSLVEEGEKWIKKTANSCMLVATLIATVVFAAAFTVPGGNDNDSGSPIFLHYKLFGVFVISDAVALISSATSILLFLSILTSSCAEDDFLTSLPLRLMFGLATLFLSVLGMVVAFSATFFMLYGKATAWVPLVISGMVVVPVYCFGVLQYQLWVDALRALKASWMFHGHDRSLRRL